MDQALSPESFYIDWHRADQISERMSPAQEALCAVMEAWGARYSDSAVVSQARGRRGETNNVKDTWSRSGPGQERAER